MHAISRRDRLRYQFDNFMSKGGLSIFLALMSLFAVAFVVMALVRFVTGLVFPDEAAGALGNELWRTFLQVTDAGAVAEDGDSRWPQKLVGIGSVGVGLVLFSSLVAFITAEFDARLAEMRKGKSAVLETGHTLLLGAGDRAVEIIRELIEANASEKRAAVVVLADTPKDELDDFFGERIPERQTTEIITRSGSTSSLPTLNRMGVARAKGVIILSSATDVDGPAVQAQADARVLKSIMGVIASTQGQRTPPIVAEFHGETSRRLAESLLPGGVITLAERSLLAKLLVQTSRTSGLAVVYSNLVGFLGNEIYFFKPANGWGGLTFGAMQYHFPQTVPIGFRGVDGAIVLNPPPSHVPADDAEAIVLAEDDSTIDFRPQAVAQSSVTTVPDDRAFVGPEQQLLVGWSPKGRLIVQEYAKYLQPGSEIDVLVPEPDEALREALTALRAEFPNVRIQVIEGDAGDPELLASLKPEQYDNVILLAGNGDGAEEMDAATIALLLGFRLYFQELKARTGESVQTQLITEVMDSDNAELVLHSGVKDFLISNQFVSKVFAQVSQEPGVKKVYDDLFSPEGSEIYLKPASLYFAKLPREVAFADLVGVAQLRNEVCFGVKIAAEEVDSAKNYGVRIIPRKTDRLTLTEQDALIVLAEDET
jgi:hypothetical protein